ncbi:MAG: hypothetical protein ABL997_04035 [Planctomycetota bacterium]
MHNPDLDGTEEFTRGSLRVLLSSGQAVVVHRLAIMSKDGDWILREDQEAIDHVLAVLESHGARYRFGAPLDVRWLRGGWSSHFEWTRDGLRIRTDFVSRPPRIAPSELADMWAKAASSGRDVVDVVRLAAIKLTNREKDYAVVGDLARLMANPMDRFRYSRSARDLIDLARQYPDSTAAAISLRPALSALGRGRDALEEALDRERRSLMRTNERRLQRYQAAASEWAKLWTETSSLVEGKALREAHASLVKRAEQLLPTHPSENEA